MSKARHPRVGFDRKAVRDPFGSAVDMGVFLREVVVPPVRQKGFQAEEPARGRSVQVITDEKGTGAVDEHHAFLQVKSAPAR